MKMMTKEKRETIAEKLQTLKYRMYQAGILLASHDFERLSVTARKIRLNTRKLIDLLPKVKMKRKRKSIRIKINRKIKSK
jgi:hypothetical protein